MVFAQSPPSTPFDLLARGAAPAIEFPTSAVPTSADLAAFVVGGNFHEKGVKASSKAGVMMFHKAKTTNSRSMGPQAVATEYASTHKQFYLVQFVDTRPQLSRVLCYYKYAAFCSLDAIQQFIVSRNTSNKTKCALFELIPTTYACRCYFDVDYLVPPGITHTEGMILDFAICCQSEAEKLALSHGADERQAVVVVKERCSWRDERYKISFHIILPFVVFANNHDGRMKGWANELDDALAGPLQAIVRSTDPIHAVDMRVYTKNRLMSCLHTVKPSTDVHTALTAQKMKTHCISFSADEEAATEFKMAWISIPPGAVMKNCFFASKPSGDTEEICLTQQNGDAHTVSRVTAPPSTLASADLPVTEVAMVTRWAQRFYEMRSSLYTLAPEPFNAGSITVKGSKVFLSAPCDKYCVVRKREHIGDAGTQTSYELNLLTGKAQQNCFSCGNISTPHVVSLGNHDIYKILTTGTHMDIAYAMKEEFEDKSFVQIFAMSRGRECVWLWDEFKKCNGAYNNVGFNVKLWVEGSAQYLKVGVVAPWIQRKFDLLLGDTTDATKAAKLEKAKRKATTPANLGYVTDYLKVFLCDRSSNADGFTQKLNRAEKLISTNDGCVVDLETCTTIPRESHHLFSMEADFHLLGNTAENNNRVSAFNDFVLEIFNKNEEKASYVQKIFGYCLTTNHDDRRIYFHVGCGSNGKTSLDECFQAALGRFHKTVRSGFLVKKLSQNSANCSPDIMSVMDSRFISCNETDKGAQVDDSRLKLMADGGKLSGRQLYEEERDFNIPGKMHVYSNFMVKMGIGDDPALTDRIVGIQYHMRFLSNPDPAKPFEVLKQPSVVAAFKADKSAVGTWLCHGAAAAMKDIRENGAIRIPQIIVDETKEELEKINVLSGFFKTHTEFHPHVLNNTSSIRTTRDISRTEWIFDKQELWATFKLYSVAFGAQDKFDMAMFNGCVSRYFANNNIGVTSFNHADHYYWLGLRRIKTTVPAPIGTIESLYGLTWVNRD